MFAVHPEKSFVPAFFKVYIEHLFGNLESEKRKYCFGRKIQKKPRTFDPKIFTNPVWWISGLKRYKVFFFSTYPSIFNGM